MTATAATASRWLHVTWWAILPGFTAVVLVMVSAEVCSERGPWLAALTARPETALPLAVLYLAGHVWFIGAVLLTTAHTRELAPSFVAARQFWQGSLVKPALVAAVLVVAYVPLTLLRAGGEVLGCRP